MVTVTVRGDGEGGTKLPGPRAQRGRAGGGGARARPQPEARLGLGRRPAPPAPARAPEGAVTLQVTRLMRWRRPQYTELFRMPQHSTMLRIISKIMITATTMAAMPMRYSFLEKSSSIRGWHSSL